MSGRTQEKYEDYDPDIEHQYMGSHWVKGIPPDLAVSTYVKQWTEITCQARKTFDVELDISYGKNEACKLDIYRSKEASQNASAFIVIHGGYWQECSKNVYGMAVFPVMRANSIAVVVGHQLAPQASLDDIVSQIKSAIEFVGKRFPESSLYLCGHSAGAHLSAMMITKDEWEDPHLPTRVQGICLVSGVYDIIPLLKTSVNAAMKMNEEDARRNSPAILLKNGSPVLKCPVIAVVGDEESPSFHKQSRDFVELLKSHGTDSRYLNVLQANHFSLMSKLSDPEFQLSEEIYKMLTAKS